jgi:hypothetical protein
MHDGDRIRRHRAVQRDRDAWMALSPKAESSVVESRTGAVAVPRFPSPLIKPDVRISRIRLSDWLHLAPVGGAPMCIRRSRSTPSFPKTTESENRRVPREGTLWRRFRNPRTAS